MSQFTLRARRTLYEDDVIALREDEVGDGAGHVLRRKVVEYVKAEAVVPLCPDGRVLLIRHYRYPIGRSVWDIPGGMIEEPERPGQAAARELAEETGYGSPDIRFLMRFNPEPAFADHEISLFRADDIARLPDKPLMPDSEISRSKIFDRDEVFELINMGEITSSWTIIGLLLVLNRFFANK